MAVYELSHADIATAIEMLLHHRDLTIQDSKRWPRPWNNTEAGRRLGFPIA